MNDVVIILLLPWKINEVLLLLLLLLRLWLSYSRVSFSVSHFSIVHALVKEGLNSSRKSCINPRIRYEIPLLTSENETKPMLDLSRKVDKTKVGCLRKREWFDGIVYLLVHPLHRIWEEYVWRGRLDIYLIISIIN